MVFFPYDCNYERTCKKKNVKMYFSSFFFFLPGLQLSMQEHALGVEAEGGTLTVLVAAVHVVTGGMYSFEMT